MPSNAWRWISRPVKARTFWGDKMTLALVTLEANAVVAAHSHVHEQVGVVIAGELEFTIGGESRRLEPGDVYVIPGDVAHGVKVGPVPCSSSRSSDRARDLEILRSRRVERLFLTHRAEPAIITSFRAASSIWQSS